MNPSTKKLKEFVRRLGRSPIATSLIFQSWRIVSGPIIMILTTSFLSEVDQGFWYTFSAISALSVFADLGFTSIVLQFSAHEFASLEYKNRLLQGQVDQLARMRSLFQFFYGWTVKLIVVAFPVIFLIGVTMFSMRDTSWGWILPWSFFAVASGFAFGLSVLSSFLQGLDQVRGVQFRMLCSSLVTSLVTIAGLFAHWGLYVLPIASTVGALSLFLFLWKEYGPVLRQLISTKEKRRWQSEIFPLLWRYALSWASGYFIFQIFTPIAFAFYGPVIAGKVGVSFALVSALAAVASVWFSARTPRFNIEVSRRNWAGLDSLFRQSTLLMYATFAFGSVLAFAGFYFGSMALPWLAKIVGRFVPWQALIFLVFGWLFQIGLSGMATYLRAHKQEPFWILSLVGGALVLVLTIGLTAQLGSNWIFFGFTVSNLICFAFGLRIFRAKRQLWHT